MNRTLRHVYAVAVLVLVALTPVAAPAQIIVHDNFGPRNTFNYFGLLDERGPSASGGSYSTGMSFTPSVSGTLATLTVAISHAEGTNDAHIYLAEGINGVPSTTLETFTLTNLPQVATPFAPETLTSVLHPLLSAGKTYYLYEKETGSEYNLWQYNNTGETGTIFSTDNVHYSTNNVTSGAYRVTVNPLNVPEPGSLALLAGLTTTGGVFALRKRRARK